MGAKKLLVDAMKDGDTGIIKNDFNILNIVHNNFSAPLHNPNSHQDAALHVVEDSSSSETDTLEIVGPRPADINGMIRRIEFLIENKRPLEAIDLALHVMKLPELPESIVSDVTEKVEQSIALGFIQGLGDDLRQRNAQILGVMNISSEWVDALLDIAEAGSLHIFRGLTNSGATAEGSGMDLAVTERFPGLTPSWG